MNDKTLLLQTETGFEWEMHLILWELIIYLSAAMEEPVTGTGRCCVRWQLFLQLSQQKLSYHLVSHKHRPSERIWTHVAACSRCYVDRAEITNKQNPCWCIAHPAGLSRLFFLISSSSSFFVLLDCIICSGNVLSLRSQRQLRYSRIYSCLSVLQHLVVSFRTLQ